MTRLINPVTISRRRFLERMDDEGWGCQVLGSGTTATSFVAMKFFRISIFIMWDMKSVRRIILTDRMLDKITLFTTL